MNIEEPTSNRWKQYEKYILKAHQERTNQVTIHWEDLTDDILIDSGWALTPNLLHRMRFNSKLGIPREYGLDAISYEVDPVLGRTYHAIQAKYRSGNKYLCANHLGIFQSCYIHRFYFINNQSRGFVYTTTNKFQKDFFNDCENSHLVQLITLPFGEQTRKKKSTKKQNKINELRRFSGKNGKDPRF